MFVNIAQLSARRIRVKQSRIFPSWKLKAFGKIRLRVLFHEIRTRFPDVKRKYILSVGQTLAKAQRKQWEGNRRTFLLKRQVRLPWKKKKILSKLFKKINKLVKCPSIKNRNGAGFGNLKAERKIRFSKDSFCILKRTRKRSCWLA